MNQTKSKKIIGWCKECKEPIHSKEEHFLVGNERICTYCFKVTHNLIEELNFDKN